MGCVLLDLPYGADTMITIWAYRRSPSMMAESNTDDAIETGL